MYIVNQPIPICIYRSNLTMINQLLMSFKRKLPCTFTAEKDYKGYLVARRYYSKKVKESLPT